MTASQRQGGAVEGLGEVEQFLQTSISEARTSGEFGQDLDDGFAPYWTKKVMDAFRARDALTAAQEPRT